ncbi:MAG: DUF6765 family protein [Lautropia sp.]
MSASQRIAATTAAAVAILLAAALPFAAEPVHAQSCSPADGGPTCPASSGAASLGDPNGIDVSVGNPIDPITGNKYQEDVDAPPLPGPLGLEIRRHFSSHYTASDDDAGRGWRLSYDTRLYRTRATAPGTAGERIQIVQADGRRIVFHARAAGVACEPEGAGQGALARSDTGWRWTWPGRRELHFDAAGLLVRIAPIDGGDRESLHIARDAAGRIRSVTDPAGRTMRVEHDTRGHLARIEHPLGTWHYAIDADGRLLSVGAPDGATRGYRYDDAGFRARITAITRRAADGVVHTVGRWRYDDRGRAIAHVRADGSELRIAWEAAPPGSGGDGPSPARRVAVLTNATGATTRYTARTIAGQWRVTSIDGPGCNGCGPANRRMRYDPAGRLIAIWPIGGTGLAHRYDAAGRIVDTRSLPPAHQPAVAEPRAAMRAIDAVFDALPRVARFEYADAAAPQPTVIARPGVVAGTEHRIEITRTPRGEPVSIVETGHAPPTPRSAGHPIRRETRFVHARLAGRHVVTAVDGPLANGPLGTPADSDVSLIDTDPATGLVTGARQPGGLRIDIQARDAGGRPIAIVSDDGYRRVLQQRTLDLAGRVLQVRLTGWLLDRDGQPRESSRVAVALSARYDAAGRLVAITDPAGRTRRIERDAQGRVVGEHDARGWHSRLHFDAEGRLRVAALHEPGQAAPLRAAYLERDPQGRLRSLLLPDGRLQRFVHDVDGRPLATLDDAGVLHVARPGWAATPHPPAAAANGPARTTRAWHDDFGRRIAEELPDHGLRSLQVDEAGRIVRATDGAGTAIDFRHDAGGRLLQEIRPATADAPASSLAEYTYEGRWLASASTPAQLERYERDALGRIVATRVRYGSLPGRSYTHRTAYDPVTGLVRTRTLVDGRRVLLDRTDAADGAVVARIRLRGARWAALEDRLAGALPAAVARALIARLPARDIVRDVSVHPFDGLVAFDHGNGVRTRRHHDPAGRLQRLRIGAGGVVADGVGAGGGSAGDAAPLGGATPAPIVSLRYRHAAGPRIRSIEQLHETPLAGAQSGTRSAPTPVAARRHFAYDRAGRLLAPPGAASEATAREPRGPTDAAGRRVRDARHRYVWSAHGQLAAVHRARDDALIARYRYNHRRERVEKEVFDGAGPVGERTHYLWVGGSVAAEIDADGAVRVQYLRLDEARGKLPIARLDTRRDGTQRLLAIHTDHRGAPIAMTDEHGRVRWRAELSATGLATIGSADTAGAWHPTLDLRLPGQIHDAETGLHDNHHRTYDPHTGRFLQPDPLGYPDGPDAYAYARGDPINATDPSGLYEEDMHYYMTWFVAITTGYSVEDARTLALAAQYVDVNPITRPMDGTSASTTFESITRNHQQLLNYHFVLSSPVDGRTRPAFDGNDLRNVWSPQLRNLERASYSPLLTRTGHLVLFGEFAGHALLDTVSHRDANDMPVDALLAGCGVGHGLLGHEPDYTYDSRVRPGGELDTQGPEWRREARTLIAEQMLHEALSGFTAVPHDGRAVPFEALEPYLRAFNAIEEDGSSGGQSPESQFEQKIRVLRGALRDLGYGEVDIEAFDRREAERQREAAFIDADGNALNEEDFPGVCVEGGTRCNPV